MQTHVQGESHKPRGLEDFSESGADDREKSWRIRPGRNDQREASSLLAVAIGKHFLLDQIRVLTLSPDSTSQTPTLEAAGNTTFWFTLRTSF